MAPVASQTNPPPTSGDRLRRANSATTSASAVKTINDAGVVCAIRNAAMTAASTQGKGPRRIATGSVTKRPIISGAAIVPVAVIGADEVHPVLWRLEGLGGMLGLPALPITPALIPLPTKWTVHVGEPLHVPQRTAATLGRDVRAQRRCRGAVIFVVSKYRGLGLFDDRWAIIQFQIGL